MDTGSPIQVPRLNGQEYFTALAARPEPLKAGVGTVATKAPSAHSFESTVDRVCSVNAFIASVIGFDP